MQSKPRKRQEISLEKVKKSGIMLWPSGPTNYYKERKQEHVHTGATIDTLVTFMILDAKRRLPASNNWLTVRYNCGDRTEVWNPRPFDDPDDIVVVDGDIENFRKLTPHVIRYSEPDLAPSPPLRTGVSWPKQGKIEGTIDRGIITMEPCSQRRNYTGRIRLGRSLEAGGDAESDCDQNHDPVWLFSHTKTRDGWRTRLWWMRWLDDNTWGDAERQKRLELLHPDKFKSLDKKIIQN